MSGYTPPQHPPCLGLRSMQTTIPPYFAVGCSLERNNSGSKAAKGVFCTEGPCHFAFPAWTRRDAPCPGAQPRQAGSGNHCGDAHPVWCMALQQRGRGIINSSHPGGHCSASVMLHRDITREIRGAVSDCPNPTTNPLASGMPWLKVVSCFTEDSHDFQPPQVTGSCSCPC